MNSNATRPNRKFKLYREAQAFGSNAGFVANVILNGHSRPTTKLAGLVELLRAGHEVSCVSFHIDILWIDGGGRYSYSDLEKGLAALSPVFEKQVGRVPTQNEIEFMSRRTWNGKPEVR
jgi:hypothetical protein